VESFTDPDGNRYCLSLTIGRARKAAKLFGIDFIDGEPAKISNDLNLKVTLQLDLIWFLLDDKEDLEQETFEEAWSGEAFAIAKSALFAEVENFIQSVRPEMLPIFQESTRLMSEQITQRVQTAISLFQSKDLKEEFSKMNADAEKEMKKNLAQAFKDSKQSGKLPEDSE